MTDYPWLLLAVYVAVVGTVQLLALWAASSRRPWLLRALAVWAPIALLASVRAYEPALLLLVSGPLTIGLSFAVQRNRRPRNFSDQPKRRLWRFRLADLLVLILLLATWLGITTPQHPPWQQLALLVPVSLAATALALLALFVHSAVAGPHRMRSALLALCVIWVGAVALRVCNSGLHLGDGPSSLHYGLTSGSEYLAGLQAAALTSLAMCLAIPVIVWPRLRDDRATNRPRVIRFLIIGGFSVIAILLAWLNWEILRVETFARLGVLSAEVAMHSIFFLSLAAFIALGTWLARASFGTSSAWQRLAARAAAIALLLVAVPPLAWLYWQMLAYAPFPSVKRSLENHYDRIDEIARKLHRCPSNLPLPPAAQAELDEAVALLRQPNYVPPLVWRNRDRSSILGNAGTRLWRRLQQAAEMAISKGQFDRAADYAIAMIRFEAMLNQGARPNTGYWGYQVLLEHRDQFSDRKAIEVIELLDKTLAELETPEYLAAHDRALSEHLGGWRVKLKMNLARLNVQDGFDYRAYVEQINVNRRHVEAQNRLLQADLAIRIYQRQQGDRPDSLQELIPGILIELPLDPYSGKPLIYRTTESGFLLYSVGPDGVDDGGLHWELIPVGVGRDMALPGP